MLIFNLEITLTNTLLGMKSCRKIIQVVILATCTGWLIWSVKGL